MALERAVGRHRRCRRRANFQVGKFKFENSKYYKQTTKEIKSQVKSKKDPEKRLEKFTLRKCQDCDMYLEVMLSEVREQPTRRFGSISAEPNAICAEPFFQCENAEWLAIY